jgi:hypothetical protein
LSTNSILSKKSKKWAKNAKIVLFSKSGKWHDPKNKGIIFKIGTNTYSCRILKTVKNIYAAFWVG